MPANTRIPNTERIRELQRPFTQEEFCGKCEISRQTLNRIYSGHRVELATLHAIAIAFRQDVRDADELTLPESTSEDHLCDRISHLGLWPDFMDAVRGAVVIGGASAMRTFTEEARRLVGPGLGYRLLETMQGEINQVKNATIPADIDALLSGVRVADLLIKPLADKLGCGVSHLAEEFLEYESSLTPYLGEVANRVHTLHEFFGFRFGIVRTIADPLDGSMNHKRGIPLFCSAIALLIEDQPRVAAIFDPAHNVVFSALLAGSYDKPEKSAVATVWEISTGHTVDLVELTHRQKVESLRSEAIAIHLPRKDSDKRKRILDRLADVAETFDSVYMLNAGIPAMILVAKGGIAAFANPWTNLHDIAAGEVLCRATSCLVTDWEDRPIMYNVLEKDQDGKPKTKTSLLAARKDVHRQILQLLRPDAAATS